MKQEEKQQAIDILKRRVPEQRDQLTAIDQRLTAYYDDLCEHSGTELGDPNDLHNGNELLCAVRFLRLLRTYVYDNEEVQDAIYDGEGEWEQDSDGFWTHIQDGLGQPGRHGNEVYRWEPFQIFCLASMYGPKTWIPTGTYDSERRPTDTERVNPDTHELEDLRRLCTRFILYGPRKINKSGYGAIHNVRDFMKGDFDASIACCANTEKQATILFNKTKDLLLQLDPVHGRSYKGKFLEYSATIVKFQKGAWRQAKMRAMPAGGKLPDGEFISTADGDEYGSAGYTNGKSDMGQTMAVIESSMGPRREPMTLITTTASLITSGPFLEMLEATHIMLLREIDIDAGRAEPNPAEDRQMMLLFEPDEWEREEEYLLTSRTLRRKVNPMLGKIVQHSFYDDEVAKSRMDETKKRETISKLFNVYESGRVTEWIKGDRIRQLQQPTKRVTDCLYSNGWNTFVGLDFSNGDDLFAITYLSVDYKPSDTMRGRFFADMEAWVLEETLKNSPNRELYELWISQGWLQVCPGEVFDSTYAINALMKKNTQGVNLVAFGYDPAQSKSPINTLKAWLQSLGIDADTIQQMVIPVSQSAMTMNPLIGHLEEMILSPEPWLEFSANPLWPWQFGNVAIELGRTDLRRFTKGGPAASSKHDNISALADALYCFDLSEGKVSQ